MAAALFALQLIHLYWLTTDIVTLRLFEKSYFELTAFWKGIIILVDYTEIPAIIATSLVYINELREKINLRSVWFLFFLNSQWLHIFWITDEFVLTQLGETSGTVLPLWLAWIAIGIDYLELPIIFDTIKKSFRVIQKFKNHD